jgi:predicted chitinase
MTIKSDSRGFLIADKSLDVRDLTHGIEAVHADTSAILSLLRNGQKAATLRRQKVGNPNASGNPQQAAGGGSRAAAASRSRAGSANVVAAPALPRDARGRFTARPRTSETEVARAVNSLTRQQATQHAAEARERKSRESRTGEKVAGGAAGSTASQTRDARGRFGSGGAGGTRDDGGAGLLSRMKGIFSRGGTAADVGDFEKVDPTIEASKEVARIVGGPLAAVGNVGKAVIGRGFRAPKDGANPWYRKIFGVLKATREDASGFGLAETRLLRDIERKTGGGGAKGGGLLGSVMGGAGNLLGGLMGGGKGLLGGLLKGGKGLLKRLPLLGALFAGGSALASIFGGDDPNKSADENRKDRFTGAGSGIGALIGGTLGAVFGGGPVGAMIGGVIGDKVGELVGGWLSTLDWTEIGKSITGAWDTATGFVKDSWKTVTDKLDGITKTVGEAWNGIITGAKAWLKDKFGIDIDASMAAAKEAAKPAVEAIEKTVGPALDTAKEYAGKAVDYGKERLDKMAAPLTNAASNALDYGKGLFGGGSKGNKAALVAQMDRAGMTDPNERAMFMAQMDHESGGFRSLEESSNYKAKGFLANFGKRNGITTEAQAQAILDQGGDARFEAMYGGAWGKKNLGNTEAGDAARFKGRGFTQLTGRSNYTQAAAGTGLDLVNHPELAADPANAAKIAAWYWQSKKGLSDAAKAGDVKGATRGINGGLIGLDDRNSKYQKYLADGSIAPGAVSATGAPVAPPTVAVAAAVPPSVTAPSVAVPAPPPAPTSAVASIPQPVGSPAPLDVRVSNDTLAGQDLRDRRLAQIATGGIAT